MTVSPPDSLRAFAQSWQPRIEAALEALLPPADEPPARLHEAMRYALFPGGKRLRPLLALVGSEAVGGVTEQALVPAAALECLHTYSLVHDDLPCMDDDDLRRGRPTCHKIYGEATALLVGDALLTLAFGGAAAAGPTAVAELAAAAGSRGMVGGQMADLLATGQGGGAGLAQVEWIHDRKTGALIRASLLVGACAGSQPAPLPAAARALLARFGDLLGRAFQIADDCLDLTGTAAELGKNPLADVAHRKLTWPAIAGLERSLAMARQLAAEAAAQAPELVAAAAVRPRPQAELDAAARLLQDVASAVVERRS